jgi:hypothetical protein
MFPDFLNFDVTEAISNFFAPYAKILSFITFSVTLALSLILFVPAIKAFVGFDEWNILAGIAAGLLWLLGVIVCFKLALNIIGITFRQLAGFLLAVDLIILIAIIFFSLIPGPQVCALFSQCETLTDEVNVFMVMQLWILPVFAFYGGRSSNSDRSLAGIVKKFFPK